MPLATICKFGSRRFQRISASCEGSVWFGPAGIANGFTTGPDVAPIHNRQIVVLRPDDWVAWIHLTKPELELLNGLPAGSLAVETVRQGSE